MEKIIERDMLKHESIFPETGIICKTFFQLYRHTRISSASMLISTISTTQGLNAIFFARAHETRQPTVSVDKEAVGEYNVLCKIAELQNYRLATETFVSIYTR